MPQLSKAAEELKRIQAEATTAMARVDQLRQKLVETLSTSTRGGTPTQGGITRVATGLEQSGGLMNRQRAGGGARLASDPTTLRAVDMTIVELINEKLKLAALQLKQESLTRISTGNVETDFTKFTSETDALLNSVELAAAKRIEQIQLNAKAAAERLNSYAVKPGEGEYTKFSVETDTILDGLELAAAKRVEQIRDRAKVASEKVIATTPVGTGPFTPGSPNVRYNPPPGGQVTPEFTKMDDFAIRLRKNFSGLPEETIQKIIDKVQEAGTVMTSYGQTLNTIEPRIKSITNGFANMEVRIATNADSVTKLNMVLDQQGNMYDKMPKATDTTSIATMGTMDAQTAARFDQIVKMETEAYTSMGAAADITGVSMRKLDDDTMMYTATVTTNVGAVEKVNAVLGKNGQLMTEQENATRKAREEQEKFQRALTAQMDTTRLRAVSKEAQRGGFNMGQLVDVKTQQPSGVSFFKFKEEADGISNYMEVAVGKSGNILNRTNRALLSFTDSIKRNVSELFKWSLGIGLVYGSYYKLQEILTISMDTQAKLVDVTISMGDTTTSLSTIFKELSVVAAETGESINEVANSYVFAYRAVGGARNEIERTAAANQLLTDSTILNKLSNMDAADSIDTLSGALRQIAQPGETTAQVFARGQELLDKWVVTTRVANVDLATLAQAFSVTAESAMNSGVSIEQLNAIIASLSEKIGGLGGKETGNAVRALIGGVYQQQAVQGLSQYGIAIEDSTGKMRDFMDISEDIYDLYKEGIIDTTELNKIGYVLGGGVRRGQQYVAFLSDFGKINDTVAKEAAYNGASQEALAAKMATVQTSSTELSNSFQALAFTLGNEGGILGTATAVMDALASLTNVITGLNEALGKLAVPAALLTILTLYTKLGGASATMGLMGGQKLLGSKITENLAGKGPFGIGTTFGKSLGGFVGAGGLMGTAALLPTLSHLGETRVNEKGELEKGLANKAAWWTAGGTVAGAIAGSLIGNPLLGSAIGSAIGEAYVQTVLDYKSEFAGFFADLQPDKDKPPADAFEDIGKQMQDAFEQELYRVIGGQQPGQEETTWAKTQRTVGVAQSSVEMTLNNLIVDIADFFGAGGDLTKMTRQQMALTIAQRQGKMTPGMQVKFQQASAYAPEAQEYETTLFAQQQKKLQENYRSVLDQIKNQQRGELRADFLGGDISGKNYRETKDSLSTLDAYVTKLVTALNRGRGGFEQFSSTGRDEITELSKVVTRATAEDVAEINTLVTEIIDLSKIIDAGKPTDAEGIKNYGIAIEETATKVQKLRDIIESVQVAQAKTLAANIQLPEVFQTENISQDSVQRMVEKARELQSERFEYLQSQTNPLTGRQLLTSEEADALVTQAEPILIYMGEQMGYYIAEGLTSSEFLSDALEKQKAPYDFMDVSESQFNAIKPQYEALRKQIVDAGGESTETPLLTFFKDSTSPILMSKDWKLVQYLLQQILDVNEEQLDGMYNLPSGASFYVPFQAYKMHTDTAEQLAQTDLNDDALIAALDDLTNSVDNLASQMTPEEIRDEVIRETDKSIKDRIREREKILEGAEQKPAVAASDYAGFGSGYTDESRPSYEFDKYDWAIPGGDPAMQEKFRQFFSSLENLLAPAENSATAETQPLTGAGGIDFISQMQSLVSGLQTLPGLSTALQSLVDVLGSANLGSLKTQLTLDSRTEVSLVVDGQTLAEIIAPYLATKMVSYESSGGGTARGYTSIG